MSKLEHVAHAALDHTYGIGRCGTVDAGHGVAWKHKTGVNLSNVRCPEHNRPLARTTRLWKVGQLGGFTLIPPAQVAEVARKAAATKKAALQEKQQSGDLTAVRDLHPGQLFVANGRSKTVVSGKVVEVERVAGGKVAVTVSRTYDEVVGGVAWYLQQLRGEDYIREAEALTRTFVVPSGTLVITGERLERTWQYKHWTEGQAATAYREARPFAGWAVEQPQCIVELWTNTVRRLREQLTDPSRYGVPVPRKRFLEDDAAYEERRDRARREQAARKERVEAELAQAEERLLVHTGSLNA